MFSNAVNSFKHRSEVEARLKKLDSLLIGKFDMSFGNRIVTQTIDFTAVFMAASGKLTDAFDYQISIKILRKILSSDEGDAFQDLLDITKDYPETKRLIEKRIKNLK